MGKDDRRWRNFQLFNEQGGKFRVGIVNSCNLACFFCHNEAMPNPRGGAVESAVSNSTPSLTPDTLLQIINAFTAMGGRQVNITGGEPLVYHGLFDFLARIDKRETQIVLNTNAVRGSKLLQCPKLAALDGILASLHTTDEQTFRTQLGGKGIDRVMSNLVALRDHGYAVVLNYSLGPYNQAGFADVLAFALRHGLPLKIIALVRPHEAPGFYQGQWVDPGWIAGRLSEAGATLISSRDALGGHKSTYEIDGLVVELKNVARGSLRTTFCKECSHSASCGEGIYGLRVGVDGLWKPCLLGHEGYLPVTDERSYQDQLLERIDAMIGDWSEATYSSGHPQ